MNYILGKHYTYSSSRLWPFHSSIKKLSFPLHLPLTRSHNHDNTRTNFRISNNSVPELPSYISSPEDTFHDSLRRVFILIGKMRSYLTKSQERFQTLFNYMVSKHQNSKLQIQSQAVSGSYISLSKSTSRMIFVSDDLDPGLSDSLGPGRGIARVFCEPSNLDPHTSRLRTQTQFVTFLSCDLKYDITKPPSSNIFLLADMDPDLSAGLNSVRVISRVFHEPFLLNIYCHDFE